jgi:hypothetical protein
MVASKPPWAILLILAFSLFQATPANIQSGNQIAPVVTVTPTIFPIRQNSNLFLTVSNGNANSGRATQSGVRHSPANEQRSIGVVSPVLSAAYNPN